jgi:lipoyl(octanoyl) transferase
MPTIQKEIFPDWHYDHALAWMEDKSRALTLDESKVFIALGSHYPSVITLGKDQAKNGFNNSMLLKASNILIRHVDRGGGATAHEAGQIVLYPVLSLRFHALPVKIFIDIIQKSLLNFLYNFNIKADSASDGPGLYVEGQKLAFVGMRVKNGITSHGAAINIFNNAELFKNIDPCGFKNLAISSLCHFVANLAHLEDLMDLWGALFITELSGYLKS